MFFDFAVTHEVAVVFVSFCSVRAAVLSSDTQELVPNLRAEVPDCCSHYSFGFFVLDVDLGAVQEAQNLRVVLRLL